MGKCKGLKRITPIAPTFGSGREPEVVHSNTKYAILVGCNFAGTPNALQGCINDIYNTQRYLLTQQYKEENIYLLTDETSNKRFYASKENLFKTITMVISKLLPGDTLTFQVSSHGGQVTCLNGDELDGSNKDETIYLANAEEVIDDEIRAVLVNKIPAGVKLRGIMDCCHSGTDWDLPWLVLSSSEKYQRESVECPLSDDIICISGCQDSGFSSDAAQEDGTPSGALTMTLMDILRQNDELTWTELMAILRHILKKEKYEQIPQLSVGRKSLEKTLVSF